MSAIQNFISDLRVITMLSSLDISRDGEIDFILDNDIYLSVVVIDENNVEFSAALDVFNIVDSDLMIFLLEANHLGNATGFGRLCIHPRDKGVIFCERLALEGLTQEALSKRLESFLDSIRFWHSEQVSSALLERKSKIPPTSDIDSSLSYIRV